MEKVEKKERKKFNILQEMNSIKEIKFLFIVSLIIFSFIPKQIEAQSQENYFSPENILRFADYLFQEKDYIRAAGEYQRYLYCFDTLPPNADMIFYKVGLSFRMAKEFEKSIHYFNKVISMSENNSYIDKAYVQIGYIYYLKERYDCSISYLTENFSLLHSADSKEKSNQIIGLNYIYQKNWDRAVDWYNSLDKKNKAAAFSVRLKNLAVKGKNLPRKNRFLAGAMSALIPGAGKIYCKRTYDGLTSFIVTVLAGWQAYKGFKEDGINSTKGWIYGTVFTFFYLGDIYGSVVAVNIYNQNLEDKFFKNIGLSVDISF